MIYEESRYEMARILPAVGSDGVFRSTIVPRVPPALPAEYTVHRVVFGDRLDTLAYAAYGDAELWWRISDANPELFFPDSLVPGQLIRVPVRTMD